MSEHIGHASGGLGYRVKRSTAVLALNSSWVRENREPAFLTALIALREVNYDFARLDDEHVEHLYAGFDDEMEKAVLDSFEFIPGRDSVRDLGGCIGVCQLCGKGDSIEWRDNKDHIRYEFKLTNKDGPAVWTGFTCIVNYSLKVKGAESSGHARKLLERSLREAKAQWKIETWRAANPDHEDIPVQFGSFRTMPADFEWHGKYRRFDAELGILGFDVPLVSKQIKQLFRDFRSATRKYQRDGHLGFGKGLQPSQKNIAWTEAKRVLKMVVELEQMLMQAPTDPDDRLDYFLNRRDAFTAKEEVQEAS